MATRVTSSHLVGRTAELAELEGALAEAADGRPSVAFLAGESGVGKSRLLTELVGRARESGAVVLTGDAVELGEGELPYAPLVAALRPLARAGDPVLGELPEGARGELSTLLPEVGSRPAASSAEDERGAAQRRLFEALLALLDRLGERAPVLLALEDLHWADRSTRAFLAFLSRSLNAERVLAVLTYRSDELHRRHPLRPLLAELERDPRARRIELARFGREELAEALEDILSEPPPPDLVDRLLARTEGNPLFAEELLAAGTDGRGGLPPTLRDALMVRVERLPEPAQEALRLLAAGRRVDHALLAAASGLEPGVLRDALREAVAGHIIVVDGDGWYAFRHALLREVIDDDLLPGERSDLHLALAHAFEQRATEGPGGAWVAAGIAEHYRAAGDQPAELAAAVRAAGEAQRVHAPGEAAALLDRALDLWERVPDPEARAGAERADILLTAAKLHYSTGDDVRSVTLAQKAIDEIDADADPLRMATALGELAHMLWSLGRGEAARDALGRGLELLPASDATPERAELLDTQVRFLMLQGRYRQTREAADEALAAISASGAERLRATVLHRLGIALMFDGEEERGIATLRESLELARESGQATAMAIAYANLADGLNALGRGEEAEAVVLEALGATGKSSARVRRWLTIEGGVVAFERGDWQVADARVLRPPPVSGTARIYALTREAELALGRGDAVSAERLLDEITDLMANTLEPQLIGGAGALRAELERRTGRLEAARATIEDALDRLEFCTEDVRYLARLASEGIAVEADLAERARDVGDADAERDALARIEPLVMRVEAAAADPRPVECAHLATARADVARARGESDPALWATAAEAWARTVRPYCEAQARLHEAEAHVAAGDRDGASGAAGEALAIARRVGAAWLAGEAEGLAARARLRIADADAAAPDAPADDEPEEAPFGLTPRELQVLALVARGATNREIGAELYMAEKTASVHVSRILAKLDVRSRTEAAAVAHRHGLAEGAAA